MKLWDLCLGDVGCWSASAFAVLSECDSNEDAVIVKDHKVLCKESMVCSIGRQLSLSL